MKVLVFVNHPAHVHLFKNMVRRLQERGHVVKIFAREKDITCYLLEKYGFEYTTVGRSHKSLTGKVYELISTDFRCYRLARKFNPDVVVDIGIYGAHTARLMNKPSIIFNDTCHAGFTHMLYAPFATVICTPASFKRDLGEKQMRYNGYHELAYLHPNYFKPDPSVLADLGLSENEKYIIVRFVSWNASHDFSQHGFTSPRDIVAMLEPYGRIFITSEAKLDADLEKYRLKVPPEKIHDLLYYATLYIGEGATIASECAVLGTPAIYVNTLRLGYLDEQEERYGLVFNFSDPEMAQQQAIARAIGLLQSPGLKEAWQSRRQKMLKDKIDVTRFMVELVEKYDQSAAACEAVPLS
jgi:predicted glycosyltransferase